MARVETANPVARVMTCRSSRNRRCVCSVMQPPSPLPQGSEPAPQVNAPRQGVGRAPSEKIPSFVSNYYQTSTFHHLSSWRLRMQKLTSELQLSKQQQANESLPDDASEPSVFRPGKVVSDETVANSADRVVFHVDMDCFYVSVAVRDNPALKGLPVAVCPSANAMGTSEVATCSYEARAFGVKSRMLIRDARALCPNLIVLPCEFSKYEQVSSQIYEIFTKYTNYVQAVSADEAFLDMSVFDDPIKMAEQIRTEIATVTRGCTASVGIAHNKLLARLATEKAKPDGVFHLKRELVEQTMAPLPVVELPGVGPATSDRLVSKGIHTIGDLLTLSRDTLQRDFGPKTGQLLWESARGIDERPVLTSHNRKSVGTQISWGVRFSELEQVRSFLADLANEVSKRLNEISVKSKRVTVKVKRRLAGPESVKVFNPGNHMNVSRSNNFALHTADPDAIAREAFRVFQQMHIPVDQVRGLGLQMDNLTPAREVKEPTSQLSLKDYFLRTRVEEADAAREEEEETRLYNQQQHLPMFVAREEAAAAGEEEYSSGSLEYEEVDYDETDQWQRFSSSSEERHSQIASSSSSSSPSPHAPPLLVSTKPQPQPIDLTDSPTPSPPASPFPSQGNDCAHVFQVPEPTPSPPSHAPPPLPPPVMRDLVPPKTKLSSFPRKTPARMPKGKKKSFDKPDRRQPTMAAFFAKAKK